MRIFQLAPIAMSISTLSEGRYVDVNSSLLSQPGYCRQEIIGHTARELSVYVDEQDYARIRRLLSENGSIKNLEIKLRGKSNVRTVLLSADRLELAGEECLLTGSVDITERKDAEARQALLVRELQHRSKNLLAVVQSIVASTLRHSKDSALAQNTILGRIQALARAQNFISAGPRGGARIDDLIRAELAPFGGRVSMTGPPLIANSTFAQMFAMVVHELATNATKYGALSVEAGRIAISWTVRDDTFAFAWKEQGGPPATQPASHGFGTQVITSALDGEPQLTYDGDGFAYAITVPFDQLTGNPST
jgi:PAS domain S-box-containing protein